MTRLIDVGQIPLGLYVHFPWCIRKCPYCDFNSHEAAGELPQAAYLERLLQDLRQDYAGEARHISTVFVGGGTPSLFQPELLAALLAAVAELSGSEPQEITLEANPGTVDMQHFAGYKAAGVNRLSLGLQSLNGQSLKALGRIHDEQQAAQAYRLARQAGFSNINLDLMHGLPNQTVADACRDLEQAISLGPEHICWYQLTIERNTHFYSAPPPLPSEQALQDIWQAGQELLHSAGYQQYEVSAYAKGDRHCAHNLNYWRFGDYLGIGAGAHGKRTLGSGQLVRSRKTRAPVDYLAGQQILPIAEPVATEDICLEFLMNALRLTQGFDAALFEQRTGQPFSQLAQFLAAGCDQGLLSVQPATGRVQATPLGMRFLDTLLGLAV